MTGSIATTNSFIGGAYNVFYTLIILLFPIYIVEIIVSIFRKKSVDWTSILIIVLGSLFFVSFVGGINVYEPDASTYVILLIPQITWIVLGIKKLVSA
jgi:hypothetical protein